MQGPAQERERTLRSLRVSRFAAFVAWSLAVCTLAPYAYIARDGWLHHLFVLVLLVATGGLVWLTAAVWFVERCL